MAYTTEVVSNLQGRLWAVEDSLMVTRCELLEEKEGRINAEACSHIIIKGKGVPYLQRSDDLQAQLKGQVL